MNRYALYAALAALAMLAACNGNNSTPPLLGDFRFANAIPDSNGVVANVQITPSIGTDSVSFDTASGMVDVPIGSYKIIYTTGNGSSGKEDITVNNVSIDGDQVDTVFGYGTVAANNLNGFSVEEGLTAPNSGQVNVQPVNASADSGQTAPLQFFFVTPGAGITGATPTSVTFGKTLSPQGLSANQKYEIIVTNGTTTIYDSGPTGISLPLSTNTNGNVYQLAALDASSAQQTQYKSAISLLLMDNDGNSVQFYNGQN